MTQFLEQIKIRLVIFGKQLRQEIICWLQIGPDEGLEMHLLVVWVIENLAHFDEFVLIIPRLENLQPQQSDIRQTIFGLPKSDVSRFGDVEGSQEKPVNFELASR